MLFLEKLFETDGVEYFGDARSYGHAGVATGEHCILAIGVVVDAVESPKDAHVALVGCDIVTDASEYPVIAVDLESPFVDILIRKAEIILFPIS